MGTAHDKTNGDKLESLREMEPADLGRLQRDLSESDNSDRQPTDQRPGGSNKQ